MGSLRGHYHFELAESPASGDVSAAAAITRALLDEISVSGYYSLKNTLMCVYSSEFYKSCVYNYLKCTCVFLQVRGAEQQVAKEHVKRDYVVPADPGWSKQWTLVHDYSVLFHSRDLLTLHPPPPPPLLYTSSHPIPDCR